MTQKELALCFAAVFESVSTETVYESCELWNILSLDAVN